MINTFLRAKHWQLFALVVGIPFAFQIFFMSWLFTSISMDAPPDPARIFRYFWAFPLMMALFSAVILGWHWSVATGLQRFIPAGIRMKTNRFKIFFFIPLVYMGAILVLVSFVFHSISSGMLSSGDGTEILPFVQFFPLIIPLHLFSLFCMVYNLYFIAKTFKTAELQREVQFSDFAGEFFLIWFYFVGVWIIQPKINKMLDERNDQNIVPA